MPNYNHIIETGKDGVLSIDTPRSHVVSILQAAIDSGRPIVLHIHGGLVTRGSAHAKADQLMPAYIAAGLFPIFIVWRTGIFDAVKNVDELINRTFFQRLLTRLLKYFVGRYSDEAGKGFGMSVEPDGAEIEIELEKRKRNETVYENIQPRPEEATMSGREKQELILAVSGDRKLIEEWENEVENSTVISETVRFEALHEFQKPEGKAILSGSLLARHVVLIAARVIRRFYNHRDHGLHATLVEEILREVYLDKIGTEVWNFMKQDSSDTFENEGNFPERGGWLFMSMLGEAVRKREQVGQQAPVVSIVGHSAGCIYAGHLLNYLYQARRSPTSAWYGSTFQISRVVFLAPATTCHFLAAVLKKHTDHPLFLKFRMYSLRDVDEKAYYEIAMLYPGSLLYIISGLLESDVEDDLVGDMPLVGMQRFCRDENPFLLPGVEEVWKFLTSNTDHLVWSGDQRGLGLNCDSRKHGEFDSSPGTVASFIHFVT